MMCKKRVLSLLLALVFLLGLMPAALAVEVPTVTAKGAVVIDGDTGEVLYEKDAQQARPAASMSKLMSLYLFYEELDSGRMTMGTLVPATPWAVSISNNPAYSGLERLKSGYSYRVSTLLELIITASCNGSVVALAEYVAGSEAAFVERMNAQAAEWGLDAHFADCTGFIDEGNAVSPHAMAEIARRLIYDHPDIVRLASITSTTFQGKTFYTTNRMLRQGTYEGIDGLKTGTTNGAGRCFTGTAARDGRRVITVAMSCSTDDSRVADTRKLLDYGFARMAELDAARRKAAEETVISITPGAQWIYPYTTHCFQMELSGIEAGYTAQAQWEVNGAPVPGFRNESFLAESGKTSLLDYPISAAGEPVTVGLRLTLPNGAEVYREETFALADHPMTVTGRMGITQVSLYPGADLVIPVTMTLQQEVACSIPAGWYLDGQPIPGYGNPAFQLQPQGASAYHLKVGEDMAPGTHTLSFICNPEGLPGFQRTEFTTIIEVLAETPAQPAETEPASAA